MPQNVFSVDGVFYDVRIPEGGIKRSFSVADTDKSGRVVSGRMFRDIIGTFYNYSITIDTNKLSIQDYDTLYEKLSAPVNSHIISIPYGQQMLTFEAYVTEGEDTLQTIKNGNLWTGLSFNFIAMQPKRRPM